MLQQYRNGFRNYHKNLLLTLTFVLIMCVNAVHAEEVTVVGMGVDKDSAVRDATRNAVEQVIGAFVDSRTLIQQSVVAMDNIYSKSQGFVKNIRVLNEAPVSGGYKVTAQIDVDTNPNGELVNQLTMLMMLNDPRISVVMLGTDINGQLGHDYLSESALNDRLLEMGFSHVVDAAHLNSIMDAKLLNNIYNGQIGLSNVGKDNSIDYLVLGRSTTRSNKITIPAQGGGYIEAPLSSATTMLTAKILKFDTGELVGTFTVEGKAAQNTPELAADKAVMAAAAKAAPYVEEKFKKLAVKTGQGLQLTVTANTDQKIDQIISDLRSLGVVQNVTLRSQNSGKALLSVSTDQKPHALLQMLKAKTKLGIFVDNISNSAMEISVN